MKKTLSLLVLLGCSVFGQMSWHLLSQNNPWPTGGMTAVLSYQQSLLLLGALSIWRSDDGGSSWYRVSSLPPWGIRRWGFSCALRHDTIWLVGGEKPEGLCNDVWCSADAGQTWSCTTPSAAFSPRKCFSLLILRDTMWVLGGDDHLGLDKRSWFSVDGQNWRKGIDSLSWAPRGYQAAALRHDTIWIFGGYTVVQDSWRDANDVWCSPDSRQWLQVLPSAAWERREQFPVVVHADTFWLTGGYLDELPRSTDYYRDVWCSRDGVSWSCATDSAEWSLGYSGRFGHSSVSDRGRLLVIGGTVANAGGGELYPTDVWYSTGLNGAIKETQPLTSPTTPASTILRSISQLVIRQPSILLDPTGRKVAALKPGVNHPSYLRPGIYFLMTRTDTDRKHGQTQNTQKIVLIE